jgi:hypothetical protein
MARKPPKTPSTAQVEEQMDIFNKWVFDKDNYLGADTRTAFKDLPDCTRIYASSERDFWQKGRVKDS